ncbi:19816_t:CDS:1, partial [Racocetra fulgida]
ANIELKKLIFVCFQEGFREFPDRNTCLFKTAIYFSVIDEQVPEQTELTKNDSWIPYNLKDITNLKVIGSIKKSYNQIADAINTKFRSIRNKRCCKLESVEEIENDIDTSSVTEEHVESPNNNEVAYT